MSRASRKELQCPECGHKNEHDANFCNKCGAEIIK
ncbi:MAG: hypothetical protein CVU04_01865 [Bacteroidetes bacterium HGW-Bacteroidetes-20]|nr:MAG: hypothetical protein CVU04_01865 [Bacteroidetes bacterium HGW-Bacteroidetes-20]